MTTYATEAGRRAWETLPRLRLWLEEVRPATLLVPAIIVQWLTTLALALTVRHNGWLFYQGGDQLWYYVSGWLLAHGQVPTAFVGHGWPALLAPIAAFPSMVAVLVCVYFALRVIERPAPVDALAAGVAAGATIAIKPSNSVFLFGLMLGFLYRRRFAGAAFLLAGLAPAVVTLALW